MKMRRGPFKIEKDTKVEAEPTPKRPWPTSTEVSFAKHPGTITRRQTRTLEQLPSVGEEYIDGCRPYKASAVRRRGRVSYSLV